MLSPVAPMSVTQATAELIADAGGENLGIMLGEDDNMVFFGSIPMPDAAEDSGAPNAAEAPAQPLDPTLQGLSRIEDLLKVRKAVFLQLSSLRWHVSVSVSLSLCLSASASASLSLSLYAFPCREAKRRRIGAKEEGSGLRETHVDATPRENCSPRIN